MYVCRLVSVGQFPRSVIHENKDRNNKTAGTSAIYRGGPRSVIHENKDRNMLLAMSLDEILAVPEERDPRKQGSKPGWRTEAARQERKPEERDPRKQGSKHCDHLRSWSRSEPEERDPRKQGSKPDDLGGAGKDPGPRGA